MAALTAEALADPLGVVVDVVCAHDASLERAPVEQLVALLAPRRATRRRLAGALLERPAVLADGRSPAPRVVGDLLVGLRKLGASAVSAPVCAVCGKELASLCRRGQDWLCAICGARLRECTVCGEKRRVASVDRHGRPRCGSCPPDDIDPVATVVRVVGEVDPTVGAEVVAAAIAHVTSRAGQRRQLAWALDAHPELLTGAGAQAPTPSVLRLIDVLAEAGSTKVVRPPCGRCGRVVTLSKVHDGLRICRGCEARLRAVPCGRCGQTRDPVTRDDQGRPMCSNCFVSDPANHDRCVGCGRRRRVIVRLPDGPRCDTCTPAREMTCDICQRSAPCEISKVTGRPWCRACQKRWARCTACGQVRPVRDGTVTEPLCATCARPDPAFWKPCPTCGEAATLSTRPCARCLLRTRLQALLGDGDGRIRADLQSLHDNLASGQRPAAVLAWLNNSTAPAVLAELASGTKTLTHRTLDELAPAKPVEHLRAMLVAGGALPARDEHMARLERWVAATIDSRDDPDRQHILRRYAIWHLLRRLRRRNRGAETTFTQAALVKAQVRSAIALLDWLAHHRLTLATADQGHLDAWLIAEGATRRGETGHFVRWAAAEKLTALHLPATRWTGPVGVIDGDRRWEHAHRLLHDDTIDPADRVAGLLVVLYAQTAAAVSRLSVAHVDHDGHDVRLLLGTRPLQLPEPLAGLVLDLVATRRGHATLGDQGTSRWLFPGGQPGRPISASRITERLRDLGIHAGPSRSAALFQLTTEDPAAVLARTLGVHIKVAVEWQRISSGDWASYAADYSHADTPSST